MRKCVQRRRLSRFALISVGAAISIAACGSGQTTFRAQAGGGGGLETCIGIDAPNSDDPNSSFVPSLAANLQTVGHGYFTAWQAPDADTGKWPNAQKADFLFFRDGASARSALKRQILPTAQNTGSPLYAVSEGNLVMLFADKPTINQASYISDCLEHSGGHSLNDFQALVSAAARARLTARAQAAAAKVKIPLEVSDYFNSLRGCYDAHDTTIKDAFQVNDATGTDTLRPVDRAEAQQLDVLGRGGRAISGTDTYQEDPTSGPSWDIDLYPSAAAAKSRLAPVIRDASQANSGRPVHVWQVGQTLVVTAASATHVPTWMVHCQSVAHQALGSS